MIVQINLGMVNVFLVRGSGGNILVDAGNAGSADAILKQLARRGITPDAIRLILITHGHTDHFGSAAELHERTGAPVAIHTLDADALRQGVHQPGGFHPTSRWAALMMKMPSPRIPACEPDILFETETRLEEYGVAGRVVPTPGHTPGSVSVLLDSGEVIVGDMVMGRLMGLIRKPGPPLIAWDLERNWESVRQLLTLSPRVIYAGHGGPFDADALRTLPSLYE